MIGRTVGNYVIQAKVGEGGMGAVYVAEHPHIRRKVAVKVLHPGVERMPEMVHRFFNEARAASEIRNRHIVEVLDFGELPPEGTPYLVMEWLEGQSLAAALREQPKLPLARVAHIVGGVARALRAAHGKGVVHRDLKPDNVFLVQSDPEPDFVKVLDFGIAKLITAGAPVSFQTQTGAIMGTPQYMSPEQCRGAKEIDHRTDIYSLGVMAHQMLAGQLPFQADSLGELLFKHLGETAPELAKLDASIPPAVSAIVARALDKSPEKRPTLDEIAAVMAEVATGAPISGPVGIDRARAGAPTAPASPVAPTTTLAGSASEIGLERKLEGRRSSGKLIVAGLVAAGLVAVVAVVALRNDDAGPPAPMAAPASAPASAAPPPAPASAPLPARVQIEIRTSPETATLKLDGETVANPFVGPQPRDGKQRVVSAELAGHTAARQAITFDRDRSLVLTLAPIAGALPARKPRPTKPGAEPTVKPGEPPAAKPARPAGYRGSNLDIETQFPAGSP
jgi:serine/threonine-protein kinase